MREHEYSILSMLSAMSKYAKGRARRRVGVREHEYSMLSMLSAISKNARGRARRRVGVRRSSRAHARTRSICDGYICGLVMDTYAAS